MTRRRVPIRLATILTLAAVGAGPATAPAESPEQAAARVRFQVEQRSLLVALAIGDGVKRAPARPISSLVRLEVSGEALAVRVLAPDLPEAALVSLPKAGPNAASTEVRVTRQTIQAEPPFESSQVLLQSLDAAATRGLRIELASLPGRVDLAVTTSTPGHTTIAQLIAQQADPFADPDDGQAPIVTLHFADEREDAAAGDEAADSAIEQVELNAPTFAAFAELQHDDLRALLGDALVALRSMHVLAGVSEADAAAVLAADVAGDPATQRHVERLLADLRREGSAAVPGVRLALRRLGPGAMTAFRRTSRDGWSTDLALNVDNVLAGLSPLPPERAASLLTSRTRLVDLLYAPDVELRRAALSRLQRLAPATGSHDVTVDPYAQAEQIEALRARVVE